MTDFLSNILSFPTLLFTGLLILVIIYWLLSLIGIADFDMDGSGGMEIEVAESPSFITKFKVDGIPVTITLSVVIFLSWVISFLVVHFYQDEDLESWLRAVIGAWVVLLSPILSVLLTGQILSPLRPLFDKMKNEAEGQKADSLVGKVAQVRTNKVSMSFGDADIDSGGASLILKIRAEEPNDFKRGDRVILSDYYPNENTYKIKSLP
jgi:hypothetical protein